MNPGRFSLFVHSLVCPITRSFLHGFQPNLVQHLPHVCSTYHTVFSLKNTLECVCERLLHCRLIFFITWTPANALHKLSVTQSILMYHSVLKIKKKSRATYVCFYKVVIFVYAKSSDKQKHLGCKKVRGQSEATSQTGRRDQKVSYQLRPRSYFNKYL